MKIVNSILCLLVDQHHFIGVKFGPQILCMFRETWRRCLFVAIIWLGIAIPSFSYLIEMLGSGGLMLIVVVGLLWLLHLGKMYRFKFMDYSLLLRWDLAYLYIYFWIKIKNYIALGVRALMCGLLLSSVLFLHYFCSFSETF